MSEIGGNLEAIEALAAEVPGIGILVLIADTQSLVQLPGLSWLAPEGDIVAIRFGRIESSLTPLSDLAAAIGAAYPTSSTPMDVPLSFGSRSPPVSGTGFIDDFFLISDRMRGLHRTQSCQGQPWRT
jgi:hypothetical protein